MTAQRYVPDLGKFMGDCEANYLRLLRLLPQLHQADGWSFGVAATTAPADKVTVAVVERSRYTTTVSLSQSGVSGAWVQNPCVVVRLYHDARMAEVLSYQDDPRPNPAYQYPNARMYQRDEKAQLNQFLGEWLDFCLTSGLAPDLNWPSAR